MIAPPEITTHTSIDLMDLRNWLVSQKVCTNQDFHEIMGKLELKNDVHLPNYMLWEAEAYEPDNKVLMAVSEALKKQYPTPPDLLWISW